MTTPISYRVQHPNQTPEQIRQVFNATRIDDVDSTEIDTKGCVKVGSIITIEDAKRNIVLLSRHTATAAQATKGSGIVSIPSLAQKATSEDSLNMSTSPKNPPTKSDTSSQPWDQLVTHWWRVDLSHRDRYALLETLETQQDPKAIPYLLQIIGPEEFGVANFNDWNYYDISGKALSILASYGRAVQGEVLPHLTPLLETYIQDPDALEGDVPSSHRGVSNLWLNQLAYTYGIIGGEQAIPLLRKLLTSPNTMVQNAGIIGAASAGDTAARALFNELLRAIPDVGNYEHAVDIRERYTIALGRAVQGDGQLSMQALARLYTLAARTEHGGADYFGSDYFGADDNRGLRYAWIAIAKAATPTTDEDRKVFERIRYSYERYEDPIAVGWAGTGNQRHIVSSRRVRPEITRIPYAVYQTACEKLGVPEKHFYSGGSWANFMR